MKVIFIDRHDNGPLYTLYKAKNELSKIIKKKESLFVCYGDINWKWDFKKVLTNLKSTDACVFTHNGFHPHLEVNSNSDFCKVKKNLIKKVLQKKKFSKDYKKDYLAIGCYYFKKYEYLNNYLNQKKFYSKKKRVLSIIFRKLFN